MALYAPVWAQRQIQGKEVAGQRKYSIIVHEGNDTIALNRGLSDMRGKRNFVGDLLGLYRSTATGKVIGASTALLDFGVKNIMEAVRDKRGDWEKAVNRESTFVRKLPMQTEILDFYAKPSTVGALDPTNMYFNGFGCTQSITYRDDNGKPREEEVFYVSCSVRKDDAGLARMLNHSKFEVVVDELRFNPYLCNLPNDSIENMPEKRIPFSFDKRKDLKFKVDASIFSSWINEAIQVHDNVKLGEFHIEACIDSAKLDKDGVFRYSRSNPEDAGKRVSVTGDSFLVPRSYVGSTDMQNAGDSWGTGQYKVEMQVSESCKINQDYYTVTDAKTHKRKWDKSQWQPEWNMIKSRKPAPGLWRQMAALITQEYKDNKWITTIAEPLTTTMVQYEGKLLNSLGGAAAAVAAPKSGSSGSGGAAGSQGQPGGTGSGNNGNKGKNPN